MITGCLSVTGHKCQSNASAARTSDSLVTSIKSSKMSSSKKQNLPPKQREDLFKTLQARFEKNMPRHRGLEWAKVKARLEAHPEKLWSLNEMERTGGEPDVVGQDKKNGSVIFFDCSAQTPERRVSLCYDDEALES